MTPMAPGPHVGIHAGLDPARDSGALGILSSVSKCDRRLRDEPWGVSVGPHRPTGLLSRVALPAEDVRGSRRLGWGSP